MQEDSKSILKLYRFYFGENLKPIMVEATNKFSARIKMQENIETLKDKGYFLEDLQRETVEYLVEDVSTKLIKGKIHTWTTKGWR